MKTLLLFAGLMCTGAFGWSAGAQENFAQQIQQMFQVSSVRPLDCAGAGVACESSEDCCSDACVDGACYDPGECLGSGASCGDRDDCCSGSCDNGTCF